MDRSRNRGDDSPVIDADDPLVGLVVRLLGLRDTLGEEAYEAAVRGARGGAARAVLLEAERRAGRDRPGDPCPDPVPSLSGP